MDTIAERAKEFAQNFEIIAKDMDCGNCDTCRKCKDYRKYVDIVTRQREIDIENACKWLGPHLAEVADLCDWRAKLLLSRVTKKLRIAMEKEL